MSTLVSGAGRAWVARLSRRVGAGKAAAQLAKHHRCRIAPLFNSQAAPLSPGENRSDLLISMINS